MTNQTKEVLIIPIETQDIKKWCVEQALRYYQRNEEGILEQTPLIHTAEEIYNWVTK